MAILFCGVVMAVGWGMRGELGGQTGAMVPGALLGLALAIGSRRRDWLARAPVMGMVGALGFALGGTMSYGRIIGYTRGIDLLNVSYGYAMLGIVGGLWGAFGAGCLAMSVSDKRYPGWQGIAAVIVAGIAGMVLAGPGLAAILSVVAGGVVGYRGRESQLWEGPVFLFAASGVAFVVYLILVDWIGLRMTPPRGDGWAYVLGALIVLIGWAWSKRDDRALRLMYWGFASGAVGFMVGEFFQVAGSSLGPRYDWWKVMEQSFGFILGAGVAYGFHREFGGTLRLPSPPYPLVALGFVVVAWVVVGLTLSSTLQAVSSHPPSPEGETANPLWLAYAYARWYVMGAIVLVGLYGVSRRAPASLYTEGAAKLLFLWFLWANVSLTFMLKAGTGPSWIPMWVHVGFLLLAALATVWVCVGLVPREHPWSASRPRTARAAAVFVPVFVLLAVALAGASLATHPTDTMPPGAHVRFGEAAESAAE